MRHYTLSDLLLASLYESFLVSSAIKSNITNKSEIFTSRRKTVTLINS